MSTAMTPPFLDASGRVDLRSLDLPGIQDLVAGLGKEAYRALQVYKWTWQRGVSSFHEMTNISADFRRELDARAWLPRLELAREQRSEDGTRKYLWRLEDRHHVESVLIPEEDRVTLCVSSQVGCAMGCRFCLTGDMGLIRNLKPSEIALQALQVQEAVRGVHRVSNIVLMGMGEPLANLPNVLVALRNLQDDNALNFSHRRITVSTAGLVPRLLELAEASPVNLAVSLNATTDEQRSALMPVNRTWNLAALLDACRRVRLPAGKRITFEYVMIAGFNDSLEDAARLVRLLHGVKAKVNLLPYNENPARDIQRPPDDRVKAFQDFVIRRGIQCSIRNSRGRDISAACGQLGAPPAATGPQEAGQVMEPPRRAE